MLEAILYITYGVLIGMLIVIIRQLRFAFRHFTPPFKGAILPAEVDLPSVSVCIPARNETHALHACLERVIASDYDKLEIIVLDDVSHDDTSVLIKSYAHAGVRFVQGKALPEGWLGKNHALQGLLSEASGSYILFMDVDTRITPDAIENTVRYALSQRATMVSVLPRREDGWRASVLFSPLRYFWEILFHRKTSPATASNAWLINRKALQDRFGGFEHIKSAIQPESKLSMALAKSNEYRFLISSEHFGIGYEKKWRSQMVTSIRLLFPLLQANGAIVIVALLDILILLAPAFIIVSAVLIGWNLHHFIALAIGLTYALVYGFYLHRVWKRGWLIGALLWPVILAQEAILLVLSYVKYKRRTVTWKGRVVRPTRSSL